MEPSNEVAASVHPGDAPLPHEAELAALRNRVDELEGLASLGELMAGILHEIKNPLSFINNFAQLSEGLVDELNDFIGKMQEQDDADDLAEVLEMLKGNLTRIRENGARAERVIRGMLARTRAETAHFEPTDLNALLEDFTKLAYQGVRAGDQEFNVTLKFDLDPGMGQVMLAPYDFNRVVMNLVLNACYAVNERRQQQIDGYRPTITVSSVKAADQLIVKIADNGSGMPEAVKSKLFTPFFTTKPVGKGTGLGLALSRDIVQDMHKGTLSVESEQGVFTEFTIRIPLSPAAG